MTFVAMNTATVTETTYAHAFEQHRELAANLCNCRIVDVCYNKRVCLIYVKEILISFYIFPQKSDYYIISPIYCLK